MSDKRNIRSRLESIQEVSGVLPTARSDGERRSSLRSIASNIDRRDFTAAEAESRQDLEGVLSADSYAGSAVEELSESEVISEQVAYYARAGFNFFRSSPEYAEKSMSDRRAAGGSGEVRRVVRSEDSLLLETARLVVRFAPDANENHRQDVLQQHGLIPVRNLDFANAVHCAAPDRAALDTCIDLLDEAAIEYAEPDFIEVVPQRFTPNDPDFARQWHHPILENEDAWDIVRGDPVRITVIDNGFDVHHPDLDIDPGLSGWYRSTPDGDDADFVHSLQQLPDQNHGTACAGMAAAIGDNGVGGCGVAFNATLSVVACLTDQVGTQLTLARALAYAADPSLEVSGNPPSGSDVISCSLGPNGARWEMRQVLSDAIDFVMANGRNGVGTPIFWASTNGNFPISADEVCSHQHTIVVGRSTSADTDNGSGFGPELDFLAPGVNVWIPASGGGYHSTTGTSFAAPCAAGVAALALARDGSLTAAAVRQLLRDKADKVGNLPYDANGRNDRFGYGRINSLRTVT